MQVKAFRVQSSYGDEISKRYNCPFQNSGYKAKFLEDFVEILESYAHMTIKSLRVENLTIVIMKRIETLEGLDFLKSFKTYLFVFSV